MTCRVPKMNASFSGPFKAPPESIGADTSDGLPPNNNGLQPKSDGLQPNSNGLQPASDSSDLIAMASNLRVMASIMFLSSVCYESYEPCPICFEKAIET